ncbi:MAG: glycoside hydrolase family 172 protein [Mangrovibacterium sp.]
MYKGSRMQFFQIQYRETGNHVALSSFPAEFSRAEKEALSSVIEVWENSGKNIIDRLPDQAGIKQIIKNVSLKAGETLPVFEMKKGGRIVGIEVVPQIQLNNRFKDLIFRTWWDNEPVAAINCPFTDFFGYAFGKPSVRSLLSGVREDGTHYCYLPMPFDTKAKLELEFLKNVLNSTTEIPVQVTVYYTEAKRKPDEGKFYAEWRREKEPESGKPYTILNKKGRGHYVGTFLQAQGLNPGMTIFFEGDDECYVDGELRLHGTGSEDYFNGGWYALADRWDQAYSLPLHGCMAYSIPLARTGGYRFKVTDKISFEKNISLSIEHGPENNAIPVDYTSVAFYYCDMPPVSNELPSSELLGQIETPDILEYWIQLLPVRAMGHGTVISYENCKDSKSAKNYEVLKLQCQRSGFAKFELEVPNSGRYKLYISWLKGPDCGEYEVNQRQIPVKTGWRGYAAENTFVEREYIGTLNIEEGTNTITIVLKDDPKKTGPNTFLLHRIFLEKQ